MIGASGMSHRKVLQDADKPHLQVLHSLHLTILLVASGHPYLTKAQWCHRQSSDGLSKMAMGTMEVCIRIHTHAIAVACAA